MAMANARVSVNGTKRRNSYCRRRYNHILMKRRQGVLIDNRGVSNIVTSIMMMGIVFTILGMVLTVYVPIWAKSLESQHMDEVNNSFTDLKSTVDSQIAQDDVGTKMTTRVTLGTEGGPLLGLGQSTGSLQFHPQHSLLSVYNSNDSFEKYGTGRGRITFQANNFYFPDQDYIFENGAVILNQMGNSLMKVEPNFYVNNVSGNTEITLVLITLQGDLENVGGIKSQSIQTTLLSNNKDTVYWGTGSDPGSGKNITLAINTSYPDVWWEYFDDLMKNHSGLDSNEYILDEPRQIGAARDNLWMVELVVLDVNKFITTIAYMEVTVV